MIYLGGRKNDIIFTRILGRPTFICTDFCFSFFANTNNIPNFVVISVKYPSTKR